MSLPNEFLMQVNGYWNVTYYLRRVDEGYYRLRDARQTDEEALRLGEFPLWDAKLVQTYVQEGTWILTKNLDVPDVTDTSDFDVEDIL